MFSSKNQFLTGAGGYQISRSVRLRSSASAYFSRTPASASNRTTWTWSGWVKRGSLGSVQELFMAGAAGTDYTALFFNSTDTLCFHNVASSANAGRKFSSAVYRDPSAWYHIVAVWDTTNATAGSRMLLYVNGVQLTAFSPDENPSSSQVGQVNNNAIHTISKNSTAASQYVDGYLTEVNFIDGQALTPSSFGQNDPVTGVWEPIKYAGTYGTNGFYLNFSDNSAATATTIGKDNSGNGNNWTPNNISVTAGTTYDSMIDVPTNYADGSTGRGNYATLNPLDKTPASTTITASNGNLQVTSTNAGTVAECMAATIAIPANSGKWYWECQFTTENDAVGTPNTGIIDASLQITSDCYLGSASAPASIGFSCDGQIRTPTGNTSYTNPTSSQVVGFAYDSSNGKLWVAVAGTWQNSGDPAAGTGQVATASWYANGAKVANSSNRSLVTVFNFGQRPFTYTPPTGFVALNTQNLPTPTISKGASYMAATLYTGTGSVLTVTNAGGFQPDLVWVKSRSAATDNVLGNTQTTNGNILISNSTAAEAFSPGLYDIGYVGSVNGFKVQNFDGKTDTNAATYVAWQWRASNAAGVTNTSGSITSTVSANTTAGFSVVTYTGNGSSNQTVGHGLGVTPSMVICKRRDSTSDWPVAHRSYAADGYTLLNSTIAATTTGLPWGTGTRTSTTFMVNTGSINMNASAATYVAYCFAAVAGYSAFGSYTGNGSTDGPFVYCGFRPRFVMFKRTDSTGDWQMYDSSRDTYNVTSNTLYANGAFAEDSNTTNRALDLLSNGFKLRSSATFLNASGGTYIYMAFAENPFKLSLAR